MPQPLTKSCLSAHDQQVLESIFNPLELTSTLAPQLINADSSEILVDEDDYAESKEVVEKSKLLEIEAVKLAEENHSDAVAFEKFKEALELTPKRASIYNNRAQALRLAGKDD
ncbi:tetratricopeptide repeat protein 36 homolog, partial [Musca vetustissima]|uniref:tetratricopeptide repeat protein 36 homolog n=1 Tax=Musca vetustissima TaxID=27455 RepID=UPI002AB7B7A2